MKPDQETLEALVRQVQQNEKYACIAPGFIQSIGEREMEKRKNLKEAVKSTRNKLHQVGSAYRESPISFDTWAESLEKLPRDLADGLVQDQLKNWMLAHTSTRERIPILERFFHETLKSLPPIKSVLDLACGLTPLSIPWMPLAKDCEYYACDIYTDLTSFLNSFFAIFNLNGQATSCDLTSEIPQKEIDLALLLKTIPCLEQVDKEAGQRLMEQVKAEHLLVSFPAHSLGGKSKGMVENYEKHFLDLVAGKHWHVKRFEFPGELAFLVQK